MKNKKIAHFKILEQIGEGGMGVVYKAEDTNLKRQVALKFLPLNAIPGKNDRSRFMREAQAAASLNHSNIATIYTIGEEEGQSFIAMEFIAGQNLKEIISKGPLKIKQAIDIACQVALGLQAAHENNVVHRDIKSANIMLTDKSIVKIMDFGLAKLSGTTILTKQGTTMGTAAYMSPEQARGENVDYRTDIWSLGVVLYEMITGELPFKGDYEQALVYAIMNEQPAPLSALRSRVPLELERIVEKCLAKDPNSRYQNANEIPVDLKAIDITASSSSKITSVASQPIIAAKKSPFKKILKSVAAIVAVVLIGVLTWRSFVSSSVNPVRRLVINTNSRTNLIQNSVVAISPDGNNIVYVAKDEKNEQYLFLRAMDKFDAIPIQGTVNGHSPFFSPDGEWVGFYVDGQVKKVSIFGGVPEAIVNVRSFFGASWAADMVFFAGVLTEKSPQCLIYKIPASGGEAIPVTGLNENQNAWHCWPEVINKNKALLFTQLPVSGFDYGEASIEAVNLETGKRQTVLKGSICGRYCQSGHLVAIWSDGLLAAPFNLSKLQVTGPTKPVSEKIHLNYKYFPNFSLANDGALIFVPESGFSENKVVAINKSGVIEDYLKEPGDYHNPQLSPDKQFVSVLSKYENRTNLKIINNKDGSKLNINTDATLVADDLVWFPDSKNVNYSVERDGNCFLIKKSIFDNREEVLLSSATQFSPTSWTADGLYLAVDMKNSDSTGSDVWVFNNTNKKNAKKFQSFLTTARNEGQAKFSPDGSLVAYVCDITGQNQVFVRSFPDSGVSAQVSETGGTHPLWHPDGSILYFKSFDGIKAVNVKKATDLSLSKPVTVVEIYTKDDYFALPAAGDKFILVLQEQDYLNPHLNIVLNWFAELNQQVPSGKQLLSFK